MTALAKLQAVESQMREWIAAEVDPDLDRIEQWADNLAELEAALSPAELGGVEGWPEYVMLRDTKLHDDMGGLGQRIFTTAGAGYEKVKYVRADLSTPRAAEAVTDEDIRWLEDVHASLKEAGGPTNNMRAVAVSRAIASLTPPSAKGE